MYQALLTGREGVNYGAYCATTLTAYSLGRRLGGGRNGAVGLRSGVCAARVGAGAAGIEAGKALQRLEEGNQRYASGGASHPNETAARRAEVAKGQRPCTTNWLFRLARGSRGRIRPRHRRPLRRPHRPLPRRPVCGIMAAYPRALCVHRARRGCWDESIWLGGCEHGYTRRGHPPGASPARRGA